MTCWQPVYAIAVAAALVLPVPAPAISATPTAPETAPGTFTTNNYGLSGRIPPGLFHCPYPKDWVGPDHGIAIYLSRPRACDRLGPSAAAADAEHLPRITIFYAFNTGDDIKEPNGDAHPPRDNAELASTVCRPPKAALPPGLRLFGAPATGCLQVSGNRVSVVTGSIFSASSASGGETPDRFVFVELDTTKPRYARDLQTLRAIAASLRVCGAPPPCPPFVQW
jgi:hypothetical protein